LQVRESAGISQEVKLIVSELHVRRTRAERMLRLGQGSYATIQQVLSLNNRYPLTYRNEWRRLV